MGELHHEIFVGVTDDVIAAGAIALEVNGRIFEYGDQSGHLVHQFLARTKFVRVIEIDVWQSAGKMVVLQELLEDFIHRLRHIRCVFCLNEFIERRALVYRKIGAPLPFVSVGHIFKKQQHKNIILIAGRLHASPKFIASLP